jgi:hypothetical protein
VRPHKEGRREEKISAEVAGTEEVPALQGGRAPGKPLLQGAIGNGEGCLLLGSGIRVKGLPPSFRKRSLIDAQPQKGGLRDTGEGKGPPGMNEFADLAPPEQQRGEGGWARQGEKHLSGRFCSRRHEPGGEVLIETVQPAKEGRSGMGCLAEENR